MAVTSQTGTLGFGAQSAKETIAATFYRHRAADIDLAVISDDRLGPPEVGGIPTPTIPYRAGVMAAGGATISPRLENTFGWLLHGAAGDYTESTGENVFGTTTTATFYHHEFTFDTTNASFVPWMTFRKVIPAVAATQFLQETYIDCKVVNLAIALPNDGLISTRVDVVGRMASSTQFTETSVYTWANEFEDYQSIPIGSVVGGFLKIPSSGSALPIVAANVTLTNAPLDIRQEKVYGSPYLEDVTITGRQATIDVVLKWSDPTLYRQILTGQTNGTQWVAVPFVTDFKVYALSPSVASTTSGGNHYQLMIEAPEVMYQMQGGIRLAGNNAVMMRLTGTAIASTADYITIHLGNEFSTGYTWPT